MLKKIFAILILIVTGSATADIDTLKKRAEQMNAFSDIKGTWEGRFKPRSSQPGVIKGKQPEMLHATFVIGTDEHAVSIRAEDGKIVQLPGTITLIEDTAGWIIHIQSSDEAWIEKHVFTFARHTNTMAFSTYTRTVHNWYIPPGLDDDLEFFSTFWEGKIYRATDQ
ncbi:MAG: hypothetical protein ACE37D_21635 [Pseudomonadales bacterium]